MGGILPLLEAFLTFALTMLALTTAVSAMVGLILRFFRSRAYGLREMVSYLYGSEILLMLKDLKAMYGGTKKAPEGLDQFFAENPETRQRCRIEFLVDMTFLPSVIEGSDRAREEIIERTKGIGEGQFRSLKLAEWIDNHARRLGRPIKWLCSLWVSSRRWIRTRRSLKYGMDTLPEGDFVTRFKASRLGKALASSSAENLELYATNLKNLFNSLGTAYSEKFTRKSRVLTVIVGFFLAFAANVDSLALIETFMTNPQIRNQIIEQQEDILNQTQLNHKDVSLSARAVNIRKLGDDIGDKIKLWEDNLRALPKEIKELDRIQNLLNELEESKASVQETFNDANDTYNDIRRAVIGVTQSFPVGWSLYPNCDETDDPRCLRYREMAKANQPEPSSFVCPDFHFSFDETTQGKWIIGWFARWLDGLGFNVPYVDVCRVDTAQYWRWLTGVVLTGLLLGLGAPFWVQVVNSFLRARNIIQSSGSGGEEPKKDETKTET